VVTLILNKIFWKDFDDQIFFMYVENYVFFSINDLFIENNSLEGHISNSSFP